MYSLNISSHGGYCCGMRHIYRFSPVLPDGAVLTEEVLRSALETAINRLMVPQKKGFNLLMEVVLNDTQLVEQKCLAPILKEFGFKLVTRFLNSNSGSWCNVFHLETAPEQAKFKPLPFEWSND